MTITVPWPPSTNTAYATVKGRRVKSQKAREYTRSIHALLATNNDWAVYATRVTATSIIHLAIAYHPPDRRKRDVNNHDKILIDAIFETLAADDSQITHLTLSKHDVTQGGRAIVTIHAYEA